MTTITILAEDIRTSVYGNANDCAITRALQRAGLHGYVDHGLGIQNDKGATIVPHTLPVYQDMRHQVVGMYRTAGMKATPCAEGLTPITPIPPIPLMDISFILPI